MSGLRFVPVALTDHAFDVVAFVGDVPVRLGAEEGVAGLAFPCFTIAFRLMVIAV
jgi:hypothetical protein